MCFGASSTDTLHTYDESEKESACTARLHLPQEPNAPNDRGNNCHLILETYVVVLLN